MSEFERAPEPGNNDESSLIDFSNLNPEMIEEIPSFDAPNAKASKDKKRWWESRPRKEKEDKREKKPLTTPRGGLKQALENWYVGIGMAMMPFDPHCAGIILENASKCAESMDEWAKTNPAVKRVLLQMVSVTAAGAVLAAHAPIIMAVMMHHIPALRQRQEKMAGDMAEMFTRMAAQNGFPEEGQE